MSNYNTAYDDVFRTLLVDCSELIIPIVNEVFHTNYVGDENVILYENEIFMKQQDGDEEKSSQILRLQLFLWMAKADDIIWSVKAL